MSEGGPTNTVQSLPQIGSYRLIQQLGSGGMSSVFRAIHTETGHEVAVKVLPRSLAKNPTLLQRFLREAKSAETLQDPNIVAIYDRGSEQGRYYLVLEYVPGGDLHDYVRNKGPLSAGETVRILKAVAKGLQHAATKGLIHRDIKPANLLLDANGKIKITDLGLALQIEEEDERVTRDGTTVGTVDYMPPEQARDSRATSIRSDIYSLGCTSYYLLTGSPPFPGGDVAEKLRRHAQESRPDVRDLRPDVPEALARLIQKMMSRHPEGRIAGYEPLLAALDAIPVDRDDAESAPLEAIVDDEDEPLEAIVDDEEGFALGEIPFALADAEPPGSTIEHPRRDPGWKEPSKVTDFNVADLAELDDSEVSPRPTRRPPSGAPPVYSLGGPAPVAALPSPHDILDEEPAFGLSGTPRTIRGDTSLRTYIVRGVLFGVAVVFIGFVLWQLVSLAQGPGTQTAEAPEEAPGVAEPPEPGAPKAEVAKANAPIVPLPGTPAAAAQEKPQPAPALREPEEPPPVVPPEPTYPAEWESRVRPAWAAAEVPERVDGPLVTVRRVSSNREAVSDLDRAFNTGAIGQQGPGTIEIADDGPFFEREFRFSGPLRLIRARKGFRPMLALEPADIFRNQTAAYVLDGNKVILDGLNLIVRADDLPARQTSLFLMQGAELTLRDCTVTVVGDRPLTFIQVGDPIDTTPPRTSRIRLERTLVRGPSLTGIRLAGGGAEVVMDRSALLCGGGPAFASGGKPTVPRKLFVSRTTVASRGPFLEIASAGGPAIEVRALGSTFARIDGKEPASLLALKQDVVGGAPRDAADWLGFGNVFAGWSGWLSAGPERSIKVANLSVAAAAWPGTDEKSQEQPAAWPDSRPLDETNPADLARLAPERSAHLARVASPSPYLWEKTLGSFKRQPIPEPRSLAGAQELIFDVQAQPWGGDLGRFLAESIGPGARHLRVRVRGAGTPTMTPVRLPDGVSLEVIVETPGLWWTPATGAEGEALFHVRGADLSITGARLGWSGGALKQLVRVENGHLALTKCWLTAPMGSDLGLAGLVTYYVQGSRPLPSGEGLAGTDRPLCRLTDCLLMSGGVALTADVARGVVALNHCAIASGTDAIVLSPQAVRRDRFQADLWLDRCTIVADRSFVRLGPWSGAGPVTAPDRPWLVSTSRSAFLDAFEHARPPRRAALLRVDEETLARGALLWQAAGDAYDVVHFTAAGDAAPPESSAGPDVRRHWVDFWGKSHIGLVNGPGRHGTGPGVRLACGAFRPSEAVPDHLALDPNYPKGRKTLDVGADPSRLGIGPAKAAAPETRSPDRKIQANTGPNRMLMPGPASPR